MNNLEIEENFRRLQVDLDNIPKPGGSYVAVNTRSNMAYVAIQFPIKNSAFYFLGRLGEDVTTEQGYEAAKLAATNVLAQVHKAVGLEKIIGLNHIEIFYQAGDDWDEGPIVANGASDLFLAVLGSKGEHTRTIFGVHKLPKNHSVALTATFTLKL